MKFYFLLFILTIISWVGGYSQNYCIENIADISEGTGHGDVDHITELNGQIYFTARNSCFDTYYKYWMKYDGDSLISFENTGWMYNEYIKPIVFNNKIYFNGTTDSDEFELWEFDGINDPVKFDLVSGTDGSSPHSFVVYNSSLYFIARDSDLGIEIWKYDGINSPSPVTDTNIIPSSSPLNYSAFGLTEFNNQLYFSAIDDMHGFELWTFDGMNAQIVADIYPGVNSSIIASFNRRDIFKAFNGKLYFTASDDSSGQELWEYDGINPPELVLDIAVGSTNASPFYLHIFNNQLYFTANDAIHGREMWTYDGVNTPTMIADIYQGGTNGVPAPTSYAELDGVLYFTASDSIHGRELWQYDGVNSVANFTDINPGTASAYPTSLFTYNSSIYFGANDGFYGSELWKYETTNSPVLLVDTESFGNSAFPSQFKEYDGKLYFEANDGIHGKELWVYDGINQPTLVADINEGIYGSRPGIVSLHVFNGKLYFNASEDDDDFYLWEYDGHNPPQNLEIETGGEYINWNGKVYFSGQPSSPDIGVELMAYDGVNPPEVVADIYDGDSGSYPKGFILFNNELYFVAETEDYGEELMKYDGISSPVLAVDFVPGSGDGNIEEVTLFNERLVFAADNNSSGMDIWQYDGTDISLFIDIAPEDEDYEIKEVTAFKDLLVFKFNDEDIGVEFFIADNQGNMTSYDLYSGTTGSNPFSFSIIDSVLYFTADEENYGMEMWAFDGLEAPYLFRDVEEGVKGASPFGYTKFDEAIYFSADHSTVGNEMFKLFNIDNSILVSEGTLTAVELTDTYQWIDCTTGSNILGATGQTYSPTVSGDYAVIIGNSCRDTSDCYSFVFTSIENDLEKEPEFFVYPNPFDSFLKIELNSGNLINTITVFDVLGQKKFEKLNNEETDLTLNTTNWEKGIYLLQIETNEKRITAKILK